MNRKLPDTKANRGMSMTFSPISMTRLGGSSWCNDHCAENAERELGPRHSVTITINDKGRLVDNEEAEPRTGLGNRMRSWFSNVFR